MENRNGRFNRTPKAVCLVLLGMILALSTGSFTSGTAGVRSESTRMATRTAPDNVLDWFRSTGLNPSAPDPAAPAFCAPPGGGANSGNGQATRKRLRKKRKQQIKRLAEKYVPDGKVSIMKPGAIKGNRTMDNPWTVETDHYIVKTDISRKASGEIALIMEMFYNAFVQSPIFQVEQTSYEQRPVIVPKNRSEFLEVLSSHGQKHIGSSIRGSYVSSSEDKPLVTYYFHDEDLKTHNILLGLGTKQFIDLVMKSDVPAWLEEGLVRYFDHGQFRGWKLHGGGIDPERLETVRDNIRWEQRWQRQYVEDMAVLTRKSADDFMSDDYDQAWTLVHFLINWKDGRLAGKLRKYLSAYKQEEMNKDPVQLFQESFGFHPEKLRRPWQAYVFRMR
jgi:hypothetical protein